ncbi:hypothetical protein OG520_40620 (plasmid) [Streptomyces sp. NBC_00984]|nr:hypothetical protein OG520_40620 [Streptomyces sp. NBC_00984]
MDSLVLVLHMELPGPREFLQPVPHALDMPGHTCVLAQVRE